MCVLYRSSSVSEEHACHSLSADSAATRLHRLRSDWLESQQGPLSFLRSTCVVYRRVATDDTLEINCTDCFTASSDRTCIYFLLTCDVTETLLQPNTGHR